MIKHIPDTWQDKPWKQRVIIVLIFITIPLWVIAAIFAYFWEQMENFREYLFED